MRAPSPLPGHKRVLSTSSEHSALLGTGYVGKGKSHKRTPSSAENSYHGGHHRITSMATDVTLPAEPIPEAGNSRLLGTVLVLVLFGAAFVTCFLAQREDADKMRPSFPGKVAVRSCMKFFGKPFNEIAMVDTGSLDLGAGSSDFLLDKGTTFVTLPIAGEKHAAEYFIYKQPSSSFGGMPYLQYGTLHLLPDNEKYSHTSNCRGQLESNRLLSNEKWDFVQKNVSFNTWDGGNSWIMAGTQDLGDMHQTTEAIILLSLSKKMDCVSRVNDMIAAFAEQDVTLPKEMATYVCVS